MSASPAGADEQVAIARLSHELKTPMAAIAAFAHLMESDDSLAGAQRERAALMREAALEMLRICQRHLH